MIARTELGRERQGRARRSPRHRARQRQRRAAARRRRAPRAGVGRHEGRARGAAPPRRGAQRRPRARPPRRARWRSTSARRSRTSSTASATSSTSRPELLAGDFAVLLEPTGDGSRRGARGRCTLRARFEGERAHRRGRGWVATRSTARRGVCSVWPRTSRTRSIVDGLEYRESLQVVRIEGGVAQQRGARRVHDRREPAVRAEATPWTRPRRRSRSCSTAPTRSR